MLTQALTEPPVEPVTLADAKLWCRIDTDDTAQDAVVSLLITAMREYAENYTGRAFVQRQLRAIASCWEPPLRLSRPPLVSVQSIQYVDQNGTRQTLSTSLYRVLTDREPGLVVPEWNAAWPAVRNQEDAIWVNYTAGYAEGTGSPSDYRANLPGALKLWMQARIATLYEQREQIMGSNQSAVPWSFADGVLDSLVTGGRIA